MKNKNKINPILVSVSHCMPVYSKGKIKGWNVYLKYSGNLSVNSENIHKWQDLFDKNPSLLQKNPFYYNMLHPVLDQDVIIPNPKHLTGYFKYDAENNISVIEYGWRDGIFGWGAERAWNFRLKMLGLINKKQNENIK
ncbi:MAG: hypothetical protein MJ165_02015 [Alphaproteobacteria bacterium]|nr:hypothetical protein [Alphaproteobacteria bacterium]